MADTDLIRKAIADRLRMARELAGLSQSQVAKMLGLHRPSISEIEAGRRRVSAEELAELARIYDVDASWLAKDSSNIQENNQARVELAARELAKLNSDDLERLLGLLQALRKQPDSNS